MVCGCARDELCDRCLDDAFAQLRGVAACRGEVWAMDVARQVPRTRPWPATDRATSIARRKVGDLSSDPRLAARLAAELERWAARWWSGPGAQLDVAH
ncbi:MAG: hypothetical protein H0T89_05755 [Deltaproteobacteria bacterium]|nr:hypothetical protein [Deltaproteobacteria bacterium]MDQ3300316.1 hypothetical protein [Myxococcota bacterium]